MIILTASQEPSVLEYGLQKQIEAVKGTRTVQKKDWNTDCTMGGTIWYRDAPYMQWLDVKWRKKVLEDAFHGFDV